MSLWALVWIVSPASAAVPFPVDADWRPLTLGGAPLTDVLGDHVGLGDDSGDLLGTASDAAAAWDADADTLFLRLQLADSAEFVGQDWGWLLDVDGNSADFEFALLVQGGTHELVAWANPSSADGLFVTGLVAVDPAGYGQATTGETRSAFENGRFYVDAQISRAALAADLGITDTTPIRIASVSALTFLLAWEDVAGCDGSAGPCDTLPPVLADAVVLDADQDGLTGAEEDRLGTDPEDADTDDDGRPDADEIGDADGDGVSDALECDTDEDGISDGTEVGLVVGTPDTAGGCFVPDADPATTTDPANADTDGGGLADGLEDRDADGAVDDWETDPNDPSDDLDSDGDGIADVLDDRAGVGPDTDSDGDGFSDLEEGLVDSDGDGTPDFADTDSDDDGLPDALEGGGDTDGDDLPDRLDPDSDDDGWSDGVEGVLDTDGDTTPDFQDEDSDGDGLDDADEGLGDTDGDTIPDRLDPDSDDDGLLDGDEGAGDTDGDGTPDFQDQDSDDDGILDRIEGDRDEDGEPDDTDGDGTPDFQDPDSDDDGIDDVDEGTGDEDCDGIPDYLDDDPEDSFCDTGLVHPPTDTGDTGGPHGPGPDPDPFASPGHFTGGSCSTSPGLAPWAPLGLALLVLRRRRRALVLVAAGSAAPGAALAQEVNAQRFAPVVDGGPLVKTVDAVTGPSGVGGLGAWLDYADDPFVFRAEDGEQTAILDAVATARLTGWWSLGAVRLGAELPLHLYTSGYQVDAPVHPGDVRLSTEASLLGEGPLHLGPYLDLSLPSGAADAWVGAGRAVLHGGGAGSIDAGPLRVAANLGLRSGTGAELGTLTVSPALRWGAGAAFWATDTLSVAAELDGEAWLGNPGEPGDLPIEGLLSLRQGIEGVGAASLGAGTGLTRGLGAPDFRVVAGLTWQSGGRPAEEPATEAPPPADYASIVVRAMDPSGNPLPGAAVRVLGTLGQPMVTGPDGILEARLRLGEHEVTVSAPNWKPAGRTFVLSTGDTRDLTVVLYPEEIRVDTEARQIFLKDKVFFELDLAELKVESLQTLDPLVELLLANPDLGRVRIEGHTDATGTDQHNLTLSQERADAVLAYLVRQGVPAERLVAEGYGETRLLQEGDSDDVHATNRRVEFHLLDVAPPAP